MPIVITFKHSVDPRDRIVIQGASLDEMDARNNKGHILVAYMNGHDGDIARDMIRNREIIPNAEWDANVEAQEKQRDDQEKAQADAEAKRKSDAAASTLALLEGKTLKGRVKRLFGRKP